MSTMKIDYFEHEIITNGIAKKIKKKKVKKD